MSDGRPHTDEVAADTVNHEIVDHVAIITLNRPMSLNAFTMDMEERLVELLWESQRDRRVRCVVITGAGRAFCAGDDIKVQWDDPRMAEGLARLATPAGASITPFLEPLLMGDKPSIAAVNGVAVGAGMDLAMGCDIRIASSTARFRQGYVGMGLVPDVIGTWRLPQLIGPSRAAELMMADPLIEALEAERLGLVSRLVEPEALLSTVLELARRICAQPPLAIAAAKEGLRRGAGRGADGLGDLAALRGARLAHLFATRDHHEAVAAFAERRAPQFDGT